MSWVLKKFAKNWSSGGFDMLPKLPIPASIWKCWNLSEIAKKKKIEIAPQAPDGGARGAEPPRYIYVKIGYPTDIFWFVERICWFLRQFFGSWSGPGPAATQPENLLIYRDLRHPPTLWLSKYSNKRKIWHTTSCKINLSVYIMFCLWNLWFCNFLEISLCCFW